MIKLKQLQVELIQDFGLCKCTFPSSGMKKPKDFFFFSGRSVSEGGTLLPRVGFTAPSVARAIIKTQGSKVTPEDTLLFEKDEKVWGFYHFWCRMVRSFTILHRVPFPFECFDPKSTQNRSKIGQNRFSPFFPISPREKFSLPNFPHSPGDENSDGEILPLSRAACGWKILL